ncbi:D-2-hydroxyacid dehydrogenase [Pseudonocardia sp. MH-G8]|uniref:D-2-hydroxyacid dehydrogenase n=1 Tax=Pseudonocardia sp. MH-G8 TaxID=1854588 RepID=UPI000BA0B2BE|nr:D-2-hydroxyacid dehydrogenase [Pseudonocardia sp. MH-G8]OZM82098.1 hydroxyacid dehydrogenase [Pseudonocardia sp. MH-G8]
MNDRPVVLVCGAPEQEQERIRAAAPDADITFAARAADVADRLPDADVVAGTLDPAALAAAGRLRWIHSWAAGVDGALFPELVASPVVLTSSKGNGAVPLAEHALMLMLMLDRDAPRWMRAQGTREWDRFSHGELNGATCGIVGMGGAGTALARRAAAFDMRVLGLRRESTRSVPGVERMYGPAEVVEFAAQVDFLVVTAALTPQSKGLLGHEAFGAMKPTAFYVCVSRGGIADDAALLAALQEGRIAGAGLDAHDVEPLPADCPFWSLPNVIVTPHNGATTAATRRRGVDVFVANLARFVRDEPLGNVVDKTAGY